MALLPAGCQHGTVMVAQHELPRLVLQFRFGLVASCSAAVHLLVGAVTEVEVQNGILWHSLASH
jgi:hypothetical protein